jgi:hypothetical protein
MQEQPEQPTPVAAGARISWHDVPDRVRGEVVAAVGSPVDEARTQSGGFSPGAAVRLRCADGTRAFVKACGPELNPDTPDLLRAEIAALDLLPPSVPHARLLTAYDDGSWVALVLEDVEGRHPTLPWTAADLTPTLAALEQTGRTRAHRRLPTFADRVAMLDAWDLVAADPGDLPVGLLGRLPAFLDLQATAREVTVGDRLVHWDARADNILLRDGMAVLLDWAWACRGAGWLDTLLLATDLRVQGGPDPDEVLATSSMTRDVPPEHLAAVVACMVGVWSERARQPAPPGLPTIRPWQAHCAAVALDWLDRGALWS